MTELILQCVFCKERAIIVGRCAAARVICEKCGMEAAPDLYKDQIDDWKQRVCEFGDPDKEVK